MASKTLFILGILLIAFLLISSEVCAKEVDAVRYGNALDDEGEGFTSSTQSPQNVKVFVCKNYAFQPSAVLSDGWGEVKFPTEDSQCLFICIEEVVDKEAAQTEQYRRCRHRCCGHRGCYCCSQTEFEALSGYGCRHRCCGHKGCYCCSQTEFDALAKAQVNTEAKPHN
ncbi:hypothetical protein AMTR_s00090p00139350 [Amborella trichopoda]|uniref:Uncharacterized protein n=1 Tax=Amborella trichopoda TaxID=13333 RepID=W1P241_AMBTC|nr:hypothetical protein AMTR_s00090p00139350 [Amborella trichopoda]